MQLPLNMYDSELTRTPDIVRAAENDGHYLWGSGRSAPVSPSDVRSLPSFPQALAARLQEHHSIQAKRSGVSIHRVKEHFENTEEGKKALAQMAQNLAGQYVEWVNFALFGKKVFYVSDGLVQQLANTRMNVEASLLQLPFPCCMLVFTSKEFIDILYDLAHSFGPTLATDAAENDRHYDIPVSVLLTMEENIVHDGAEAIRTLSLTMMQSSPKGGIHLDLQRMLPIRDDWTINQVLVSNYGDIFDDEEENKRLHEQVESLANVGMIPAGSYISNDDIDYSAVSLAFRVIINSILYIDSVNAEQETVPSPLKNMEKGLKFIRSEQERNEARKKMKHLSQLSYIVIGGSIKPIAEEHSATSTDGKRSLTVRFMVKGFFRQQVFGPGRGGRRRQWIKPFYKGPEMADLVNKPYVVRGKKTGTE